MLKLIIALLMAEFDFVWKHSTLKTWNASVVSVIISIITPVKLWEVLIRSQLYEQE